MNSARLAQSVEHETLNLRVVGSSPTLGVVFFFLEVGGGTIWKREYMNPVIFNFLFQFLQEQLLQNGKEEDISTITLKGNLPSTERVVLATFTVDVFRIQK